MVACEPSKLDDRVRISVGAPKFNVGDSSSGKTTDSDSVNLGSIPRLPAKFASIDQRQESTVLETV